MAERRSEPRSCGVLPSQRSFLLARGRCQVQQRPEEKGVGLAARMVGKFGRELTRRRQGSAAQVTAHRTGPCGGPSHARATVQIASPLYGVEGTAAANTPRVYRRRPSERTVLYRALAQHFERFLHVYEERFEYTHGYLRRCVQTAVDRYLDCDIFRQRRGTVPLRGVWPRLPDPPSPASSAVCAPPAVRATTWTLARVAAQKRLPTRSLRTPPCLPGSPVDRSGSRRCGPFPCRCRSPSTCTRRSTARPRRPRTCRSPAVRRAP